MKLSLMSLVLFGVHSDMLADVKLPAFFSDHMVFQREMPVPVWGTADAGEIVTVAFAGQQKTATTDASGKWRVVLDKLSASAEPRELMVSGNNARKISDVLVGEVWLASGQSNMGFLLSNAHNAADALASATDAQLRVFTVQNATAAEPQGDVRGKWEASDPKTAKSFSAVAYFFARELRAKLGYPVAILCGHCEVLDVRLFLGRRTLPDVALRGWHHELRLPRLVPTRSWPAVSRSSFCQTTAVP